jgi:hypothetical protein
MTAMESTFERLHITRNHSHEWSPYEAQTLEDGARDAMEHLKRLDENTD